MFLCRARSRLPLLPAARLSPCDPRSPASLGVGADDEGGAEGCPGWPAEKAKAEDVGRLFTNNPHQLLNVNRPEISGSLEVMKGLAELGLLRDFRFCLNEMENASPAPLISTSGITELKALKFVATTILM